jgi:hypothetical protein
VHCAWESCLEEFLHLTYTDHSFIILNPWPKKTALKWNRNEMLRLTKCRCQKLWPIFFPALHYKVMIQRFPSPGQRNTFGSPTASKKYWNIF